MRLTDDALFKCPYLHMEDVGTHGAQRRGSVELREYLLKGGFLWVDDYWGSYAWEQLDERDGPRAAAGEYPDRGPAARAPDLQSQFQVKELPQIPAIQSWRRDPYETSERGAEEPQPALPRHLSTSTAT